MPRLTEISGESKEYLGISSLSWLNEAVGGGFVRGGIYLLAGEPGIGKSTLALQILGDAAKNGMKVLYVSTEQGLGDVKRVLQRIHGDSRGNLPSGITDNFYMEEDVNDIDNLPDFFTRKVLTAGKEYNGTQVIVLDSVQGRGLSAAATKKYKALYKFAEEAKASGLVTLLIGHVTKKGQIAGPKDLEHNVDCVLYIRRAFRLRPFFVPKNRFGPSIVDPIVLIMNSKGQLEKSPLTAAKSSAVHGYGGMGEGLAEGQASVSLPKYGFRPELNAPFLPGKKIKQLLAVLSTMRDVDIGDLSYEINCYIPKQQRYREELDLPLAVALLSSYFQQPVDQTALFAGELDLTRRVRSPERTYLASLASLLMGPQKGKVKKVYVSGDAAPILAKMQPEKRGPKVGEIVDVRPVNDLETVLKDLWPDILT